MHVAGPRGANLIVLDTDVEVVGAAIDGRPIPARPLYDVTPASPWTLNFWNPPAQGFDLTLEVKGAGNVRLTARASSPGLPPIPGMAYRARPPELMPISTDPATIEQDSSTVVSRSFTLVKP